MISVQIDLDSPTHFSVLMHGERVRIIKNPALTAHLPYWAQQDLANQALSRAGRPTPKVCQQVAEVVMLDALRQAREERVSVTSRIGT